jgi:DNA-binding response OmpR family regulator
VEICFDRQLVVQLVNGNEISLELTAIEQKILIFLSNRMEQVFSRLQILDSVWHNSHIADRTVDSHIAHLRNKLKNTKVYINTSKGLGYYLTVKKD